MTSNSGIIHPADVENGVDVDQTDESKNIIILIIMSNRKFCILFVVEQL